jgi:transposase
LSTISYQLKKLRNEGSLQHRAGNGRRRKINPKCSRALGQFISRNNEVTLNELAEKLRDQCKLTISTSTISRHLNRLEYKNFLPLNTPMLTQEHKERRVEWAKQHLNDNWKSTVFTDECSFQLFRNTIRRWSKNPKEEKKNSEESTKSSCLGFH